MHEARRKSWDAITHGSWRAQVRTGESHFDENWACMAAYLCRHILGLGGLHGFGLLLLGSLDTFVGCLACKQKMEMGPRQACKKMVLGLGPLAPNE